MTKLFLPPHIAAEYRAKQNAAKQASDNLRENNKMEDNAEYQKRKLMSRDEKYVDAIQRLIYARKQYNDALAGHDTTLEQARKDMLPIIMKFARNKGIE